MIIDCDRCAMQYTAACDDCVVTALVGIEGPYVLGEDEGRALRRLSDAGLVAPIRLVERRREGPETGSAAV